MQSECERKCKYRRNASDMYPCDICCRNKHDMYESIDRLDAVDVIAKKLRSVAEETKVPDDIVIISSFHSLGIMVCGYHHLFAPSLANPIIANWDNFKMCRLFEDS